METQTEQTELQQIIEQRAPRWPEFLSFKYNDKVKIVRAEATFCRLLGRIVGYEIGTFGVIYIVKMFRDGNEWPFRPSQLQIMNTGDKPTGKVDDDA